MLVILYLIVYLQDNQIHAVHQNRHNINLTFQNFSLQSIFINFYTMYLKGIGISSLILSFISLIIASDEMRKKLYGSVLLIGGGLSYPGAATMLQQRLEASLSQLNKGVSSVVEVCSSPRVSF